MHIFSPSVKSATAFAPGQQENKTINQSLIHTEPRTSTVCSSHATKTRKTLPPLLISFSLLSLWWWPPSQRDHKQWAERFQTDGSEEGEQMNAQKNNTRRGVWKSQSGGSVSVGGGLRYKKKGQSMGVFSEGMMIAGKVNSFAYEKRLGRLLDLCNIVTK